ncbi:hypothetical protein NE237_003013 [Protea cynaroides]|uniref:VQ domain-containing protein n=1 Tax=Protea cynaroides TaxID=273540 RepID=A0A9Q0QSC2_9MAGN|nr:hypothetical protein NE237_003013 [Protea cynaroides]
MDKFSTVHRSSKCSKHSKSKKKSKPIRVVYISNPMKVKTSASEFRALVQELTGRDSDLGNYNGRFSIDGHDQTVPDEVMKIGDEDEPFMKIGDGYEPQVPQVDAYLQESPGKSDDTLFEADQPFDDLFGFLLLENFCLLAEPPRQ